MYKPIRDAVGHTSIIIPTAKTQLSIEYENIKARLVKLLQEIDTKIPDKEQDGASAKKHKGPRESPDK